MTAYDEKSIVALTSDVDRVRKKPAMYIGATDVDGMHRILREALDNCVDEHLATKDHKNGLIKVMQHSDFVYVLDRGRGIPVGINQQTKLSTLTTVMTTLHAGGKLDKSQTGYSKSTGVHGVGVSCTNFLSSSLEIWTYRDAWYYQKFVKGVAKTAVIKQVPPEEVGKWPTGTIIKFKPDASIFKCAVEQFSAAWITEWMAIKAYLNPGLKLIYQNGKDRHTFVQPEGIIGYVGAILKEKKATSIQDTPFVLSNEHVDVALCWSSHDEECILSYVNSVATAKGGTHVKALRSAVIKALTPHVGVRQAKTLDSETLLDSVVGVINYKLDHPEYSSQIKEELTSTEPRTAGAQMLTEALTSYFKTNKALAKAIISRAVTLSQHINKFKADKKLLTELRQSTKSGSVQIPLNKFKGSQTSVPAERELYIVEGESAGGSASAARESQFQELLMLKGKPINPYAQSMERVTASTEIKYILKAIGYTGEPDWFKSCRIGKIMLLMDADDDGYHISVLVLAVIQMLVPELIANRMVYKVDAPLFMAQNKSGSRRVFGNTIEEATAQLPEKERRGAHITRFKGWGEASADVLKDIAFDIDKRKLINMKPLSKAELTSFTELLGKDAEARKNLMRDLLAVTADDGAETGA